MCYQCGHDPCRRSYEILTDDRYLFLLNRLQMVGLNGVGPNERLSLAARIVPPGFVVIPSSPGQAGVEGQSTTLRGAMTAGSIIRIPSTHEEATMTDKQAAAIKALDDSQKLAANQVSSFGELITALTSIAVRVKLEFTADQRRTVHEAVDAVIGTRPKTP